MGPTSPQHLPLVWVIFPGRVGLSRIPKPRPLGIASSPLQPAARVRGLLIDPISSNNYLGGAKNLLGEILAAQFRVVPAQMQRQVMGQGKELGEWLQGSCSRSQFKSVGALGWGSAGKGSWMSTEMLCRQARGCRRGSGKDGDL